MAALYHVEMRRDKNALNRKKKEQFVYLKNNYRHVNTIQQCGF